MPFNWTLNPYRGCTHACHYCFARRYQTQFELGPGDEFSSRHLREDQPRSRCCAASWTSRRGRASIVAVGTATDPYQPIEGHYKLTRRSLEALLAGRTPVGLVTKGPMVVRDARPARRARPAASAAPSASACRRWTRTRGRALEPGTAHPLQRLRAVRQLRDAGVNAGVLMAPVVPGFTHRSRRSSKRRSRRSPITAPRSWART